MIAARFKLAYTAFVLDVDLELPARGVTALFGPSGSGKTTLLRCIAGLERATDGLLRVHDEVWQGGADFLPTHRRPLGYVFQEASLFPHLSVRRNLEYGMRRIPSVERKVQPEQVVELMGLSRLIERDPAHLSGGERQRVAIGRALLTSPRLLLMDEPLSALDVAGRQEILPYLERLHGELGTPVIYVSHTLDEVARLADHVVMLEQGRVIASGAPGEILTRLDLPTAHLDNAGAVIEAAVAVHDEAYHLTRLDFSGGCLWVSKVEREVGSVVRARVLARDVSIATVAPQGSSIINILAARIAEIQDEGLDRVNLRLAVGGKHMLLSRITRRSRDQLGLAVGAGVFAQVKSVALIA
ncbi:MAG: molybdenum ABC transporter ATP-binding protein [Betaproteobacteria bacterium]|nr:molybdenum ABC transporter ATP-binding protein [Betaproteobacteria bacterium]